MYEKYKKQYEHLTISDIENMFTSKCFSIFALAYSSIMIHSSAIVVDGNAYLFSANSGVGKSTHTKLWQKYLGNENTIILNDDKPILKCYNDKIIAYGSPWAGNSFECENIKAPVKGIVFLSQGDNNIEQISDFNFIMENLLQQTIYKLRAEQSSDMLENLSKIISNVPFYSMSCDMTIDAAKMSINKLIK